MPTHHVISEPIRLEPSNYSKRMIAYRMYFKGKQFVGAALLLQAKGGDGSVVRHLLCQGVELVLKGLLLLKGYDTYKPKLRKLGHHLCRIAQETSNCYGVKVPAHVVRELDTLNSFFSIHAFRYAGFGDVMLDLQNVPLDKVLRRIAAVIRLTDRSIESTGWKP